MPDSIDPIMDLQADDPVFQKVNLKPYRNAAIRRAEQFLPEADEEQSRAILCPWGETLDAHYGDYIVSEKDDPDDCWPVSREIFEKTYVQIGPDLFRKKELTCLVPLVDITADPEQKVRVHTQEGVVTVRAGDFHLAKGIEGEIWPIPNEKVQQVLVPVDEETSED